MRIFLFGEDILYDGFGIVPGREFVEILDKIKHFSQEEIIGSMNHGIVSQRSNFECLKS